MKSKNVGSDDNRRINILNELTHLPVKVFSVAVDKSAIFKTSGLIYKRPFIKYINGILYRKLFKTFPSIKIYADEQGSEEFQKSFQKYIIENHMTDLFRESDLKTVSSKDEVLIQVADMFAGSIARKLDYKRHSENSDTIFNVMRSVLIAVEVWPPERLNFETYVLEENPKLDILIQDYCLNQAKLFISNNIENEDENIQLQIETLKYMLFHFSLDEEYDYIRTEEILDSINATRFNHIKVHFFRSNVIAALRESEVIIAGSSKGLKIPTSLDDLKEHTIQTSMKVFPMVKRMIKARNQIKILTKNDIDLFSEDRFDFLRLLSEKLKI
jgi:hypothetical protein